MAGILTDEMIRLLEEPHMAHLATVNADGSPQVSPVWVHTDGEAILMNTATGRIKHRNLVRDPRAAVSIADAAHPYSRTLIARGRVELITEGGLEHIDSLSRKYDDLPWEAQPGDVRVIIRLIPETAAPAN